MNNSQMRIFFEYIIQNGEKSNRKRQSANDWNVTNVFDSSNRKNDSKIRKEELELMELEDQEDDAYGGVDVDSIDNGRRANRKRRPGTDWNVEVFDASNRKNDSKMRKAELELMNLADQGDGNDVALPSDSDNDAYEDIHCNIRIIYFARFILLSVISIN